jgi:RecB family exonuclease
MWIGTQLHLTPMTPEHEWPLYLEIDVDGKPVGVHGRVDEIYRSEEGPVVIVDKKFTSTVPKTPNEHYMTQVSYYAGVFAHQTGAKVTHGALLYFSPFVQGKKQDGSAMYGSKERMRVFVFPVDTDKAWNELHEKVRAVQRAINAGTVIDRTTGWLCRYCKWKGQCEALSGPVHMNGNQKLLKDG